MSQKGLAVPFKVVLQMMESPGRFFSNSTPLVFIYGTRSEMQPGPFEIPGTVTTGVKLKFSVDDD